MLDVKWPFSRLILFKTLISGNREEILPLKHPWAFDSITVQNKSSPIGLTFSKNTFEEKCIVVSWEHVCNRKQRKIALTKIVQILILKQYFLVIKSKNKQVLGITNSTKCFQKQETLYTAPKHEKWPVLSFCITIELTLFCYRDSSYLWTRLARKVHFDMIRNPQSYKGTNTEVLGSKRLYWNWTGALEKITFV